MTKPETYMKFLQRQRKYLENYKHTNTYNFPQLEIEPIIIKIIAHTSIKGSYKIYNHDTAKRWFIRKKSPKTERSTSTL